MFSRTSHNEHSTQTFYGRRTNVVESPERAWQPGQYIPSVSTESTDDIHSLLAGMQQSITKQFDELNDSVRSLSHRLDKLEDAVSANTDRMNQGTDLHETPTPSSDKRTRSTPSELSVGPYNSLHIHLIYFNFFQNLVRIIHKNLSEENQLKVDEP